MMSFLQQETNFLVGVLEQSMSRNDRKLILAGGMAGCVAKTAVAPLSRVTILMQVQSMRPNKFDDGIQPNNRLLGRSLMKIYAEEGMRGFWTGNGAMVIHRFPYTGLVFWIDAAGKRILERWFPQMHARGRSFMSAGASAAVSVTICYPLDVVKTRLTTQTKTKYYTGICDCLSKIWRDEGFTGYYRGLAVSGASVVPMVAMNFTLYEHFFQMYAGLGLPNLLQTLGAGATSGALSSTIFFPIDLLRRQMQMVGVGGRAPVYSGIADAVRQVYSTGASRSAGRYGFGFFLGMREFFRGLVPELIKVAPNSAIMFSVQNWLINAKWL